MASLVAGKHTFTTNFFIHLLFLLSKNLFTPSPSDSIKHVPSVKAAGDDCCHEIKGEKGKGGREGGRGRKEKQDPGADTRHKTTELKASFI